MLKGTEIFLWVNKKYLGYCYPTLAKSWVTLLISCKIGVFTYNTTLWERTKMLQFASLERVGLEKSVADNYLWVTLNEHNCHGFCLTMERFSSCLF